MTLSEAYRSCSRLAQAHYENFPVGRLVSAQLAPHIHAVYAFARYADDLADEGYAQPFDRGDGVPWAPTPQERIAALLDWQSQLLAGPEAGSNRHPIFIALHETIRLYRLPIELFTDLLSAFMQDVEKRRYDSFAELLDYSRRSANPIGRLVLLLHEQRHPEQLAASDNICTALQLANFWQDVRVDLTKDRVYLPQEELAAIGLDVAGLHAAAAGERRVPTGYCELVASLCARTQLLFGRGYPLIATLPMPLRAEIALTWQGGNLILDKIEQQGWDTLSQRPKVSKSDLPLLLWRALLGRRR